MEMEYYQEQYYLDLFRLLSPSLIKYFSSLFIASSMRSMGSAPKQTRRCPFSIGAVKRAGLHDYVCLIEDFIGDLL